MTVDGPAPPALGLKVKVAATPLLPATRSAAAMINATVVTAPPITPQDTAGLETVGSLPVCTVTESVAALAMPKVKPISVIVTACPLVNDTQQLFVKTMENISGVPTPMFTLGVDTYAIGVETLVKKPDG